MKKIISLFIVLFMCLGVTGCHKESKAEKNFNTAVEKVKKENKELDKKIKKANKLVKSKDKSLDENLRPTLETVISETKASKYKIIDLPDKESKIEKETKKMNNYLNTHFPQVIIKIRNDSFNFLGIYV